MSNRVYLSLICDLRVQLDLNMSNYTLLDGSKLLLDCACNTAIIGSV